MIAKLKNLIKRNSTLLKVIRYILMAHSSTKKKIIGKGNNINVHTSVICSNCDINIIGDNNQIIVDDFSVLNNVTFYIRGNNNLVHISKSVIFNRGGVFWIEDNYGKVVIGENSTFEDVHIAVTESNSKIIIGKDCMFANDIDIRTGDSHSILEKKTNKRINFAQNIEIGNHVWVGAHVSILKGVVISAHSIVATRAVVTKKFLNQNILIGGLPAKIIKEEVDWYRRRIV